jgi:hypothetical protein
MLKLPNTNFAFFSSSVIALLYGLWARVTFQSPWQDVWDLALGTITLGFCFAVPMAIGALTVFFAPKQYKTSWLYALFMPWAPCVLLGGAVLLFGWEFIICVVMALPIFFTLSSFGGLIMMAIFKSSQNKAAQNTMLGLVVVLPYLITPLEKQLPPPDSIRTVETQIEIQADHDTVWRNVVSVPEIRESEQSFSLFHLLGLPRPIEATLSYEGIGAIRNAKFEEGLAFSEIIQQWEDQEQIRFQIEVAPSVSVQPPLTQIGGQYLDVFEGGFTIEPIGDDRVILHLSSQHRLSTTFNFYGGLWTDWVMRDLQNYILRVIKARCEAE